MGFHVEVDPVLAVAGRRVAGDSGAGGAVTTIPSSPLSSTRLRVIVQRSQPNAERRIPSTSLSATVLPTISPRGLSSVRMPPSLADAVTPAIRAPGRSRDRMANVETGDGATVDPQAGDRIVLGARRNDAVQLAVVVAGEGAAASGLGVRCRPG